MKLLSIQVGTPQRLEPVEGDTSKKGWTTSFFKQPVDGPVAVARLGLDGDEVTEKRVHGGPDKAVCVYASEHWPYWRDRLDEPAFGEAAFGENFSIQGLTEPNVAIGDVWRIGSAAFQVSQPRQPCWKLARRWKTKQLTLWVQQNGYTGWYLRVLEEGEVAPGDAIAVEPHTDGPRRWTIADANAVMFDGQYDAEATAELAAFEPLANSWKRQLTKRLAS